jgi:uncharacterized protein YcgI (DUF1989 family)
MATMIADTVPTTSTGLIAHDLLGTRCDPYMYRLVNGTDYPSTCHDLLTRAISSHGLHEADVHDVLNLFQAVGIAPEDGMAYVEPSPARAGDYVEFYAEMDLLCAIATCHSGDFSKPGLTSGTRQSASDDPPGRPLLVEVFEL